jgi:streptogramin lyase
MRPAPVPPLNIIYAAGVNAACVSRVIPDIEVKNMRTAKHRYLVFSVFSLVLAAWLLPASAISADWANQWRAPDPQSGVRLQSALAITVDPERERFYLADGIAGTLHAFDLDGQHLSSFNGEGKLGVPVSLTLQRSGRFWIIDRAGNALLRVIPEEERLERFPFPLQGQGAMLPQKVVWHPGAGVLILDRLSGQVLNLDDNLKIKERYGRACTDVVSANGSVWILQEDKTILQINPQNGQSARKVKLDATLARPVALERNPEGQFLIADRALAQVLVFSPEGRHLYSIGAKGRGVGRFSSPRQVVSLSSDTHAGAMLVLDEVNRCVDMFVR